MTTVSLLFTSLLMSVSPGDALRHLEDNSPACDLVPAYGSLLAENVRLALLARDSLPWGAFVPDSILLRFVLPVRVSQEPLTNWRPVLFDELMPLVRDAPDMEIAAVRVLSWCDEAADFMQTQRRDQSPLVTMSSGTGRCEELTILQMDALRAVCIPCRQVYTPWWMVCDNNHAWTEIWTSGGWVSTESGLAVDSLTQPAWFAENASRAALVVAVVQDSVAGALLRRGNASLVNVTPSYAPTGNLEIQGDFGGDVFVSIVNWGALRTMQRLNRATSSLILGEGTYMLTWGWPVRAVVASVREGETTTVDPSMGGEIPDLALMNLEGGL